jgi:hypothetical protein
MDTSRLYGQQPPASTPPPSASSSPPPAPVTRSSHFPPDINERFFGCIQVHPTEQVFENLETDEHVVLHLCRHWVILIRSFILTGFFALLPIFGFWLLLFLGTNTTILRYLIVASWFWYCALFYYVVARLLTWRSDVYIITNERMIDFEANTLFYKKATDIDLDSIHEVTYASGGGLIRGSINTGDIELELVNGNTIFMKNIPMANQVALVIGELVEEARKHHPAPDQAPPVVAAAQ